MTMNDETEHDDDYSASIDPAAARADAVAGARALKNLLKTAGHNWSNGWSIAVRGWRGLRSLAFKRAGVSDTASQAYRDAMSGLLEQAQWIDYRNIPKETRAAMTRLVDHIDEIDQWHATLSVWEKERWTNPQTICKHCPKHLLAGRGHNRPPLRRSKAKKKGNPEADRLRAILIAIITEFVMPTDPGRAKTLLASLYPDEEGPNDSLDDLGVDDDGDEAA
jgi:hypothetical protein